MARQRHKVERRGRRWAVRREDRPDDPDEFAASFEMKTEAERHARRVREYWERGMGERP
ncbi:MAG TPA: hypothetical protein VHL78_09390 [Actinomycetota bacterium]|nr:hypothetical protein [Actinomycetota bacterium]